MATKSQKRTGSGRSGSASGAKPAMTAEDFMAMKDLGFGNMANMGTAWVEALTDMGSEVISFVADRIREDVKTQHEILHCKDVAQLQHIQAEFIQKAVDQYTAETGKLVKMSEDLFKPAKGGGK